MKPLDIDGNELKVGDDVELCEECLEKMKGDFEPAPIQIYPGDRFKIDEIEFDEWYNSGFGACGKDTDYFDCCKLRLIPRDTKAPTKIEFVTTKEGVR